MKKCVIKLIIKTSNELDQIIFCNINWNIGQLKEHISKVYKKKTKYIHQNLFYYGELLDNSEYLKNIFQKYKESEQIFIIHLTCKISFNNLIKNLENKYSGKVNECNSIEGINLSWKTITSTQLLLYQHNYLNENQRIWIKQAYEHYLTYYMQLLAMNGFQLSSTFSCSHTLKLFSRNVNNTISHNLFNNEDQQQQMILYRADVPNFNNQNNNNNNNNNNNDNVEDDVIVGNNRDWLDNFYMLSRIIILFSIVYFYSSPLRFIVVTFSGFLIYLYHHGFFNTHQFVLTDDNNAQIENNNQIEQNEQNHIPEIHLQENQLINEIASSIRIYHNNENTDRRPGLLWFIWIFFSSFFASLVPDQLNIA